MHIIATLRHARSNGTEILVAENQFGALYFLGMGSTMHKIGELNDLLIVKPRRLIHPTEVKSIKLMPQVEGVQVERVALAV